MPHDLRSFWRSSRHGRVGAGAIALLLALAACGHETPEAPALATGPSLPPTPKPFEAPPQPHFSPVTPAAPGAMAGSPAPDASPSINCLIGPQAGQFGLPSARQAPGGDSLITPLASASPSGGPADCPATPYAPELLGFWQIQPNASATRGTGLGASGNLFRSDGALGVLRVDADGTYQWIFTGRVGRVGKLEPYTPRNAQPQTVAYKASNGTEDFYLYVKDGSLQVYSVQTEQLTATGKRADASVDQTNMQGLPTPGAPATAAPLGGSMSYPGGQVPNTGLPPANTPARAPIAGIPAVNGMAQQPGIGLPMTNPQAPLMGQPGIGGVSQTPMTGGPIGTIQPGQPYTPTQPGVPGAAGGATGGAPPVGGPVVAVSAPPPIGGMPAPTPTPLLGY